MLLMAFPRGSRSEPHINCLDFETTTRATGATGQAILFAFLLEHILGSLEMEIATVIMEMMTSLPRGHTTM